MERNPYYSLEAEEAVIGALLLEGDLIKDCSLMSEHFYSSKLRFIYLQMLRLEEKEKPIDMVSVVDAAGPENWLKMGGGSYLSELSGSVPTTVNFHYYEEIVKKYYQKRKTNRNCASDEKGKCPWGR